MKHTIYKFCVDFEKEEKWLNKMATKGLHMIDYCFPGRYRFEEGKPGEYVYRLELLENVPAHPESQAYLKFMEESGAETVAYHFRWVFFRKNTSGGPFEIYSDNKSKYIHYKRIVMMVGVIAAVNLLNGINLIISALKSGLPLWLFVGGGLCLTLGAILTTMVMSYLRQMHRLQADAKVFE